MKAIIVDDEKESRTVLRKIISTYCTDIRIIGEASTVEDAYVLMVNQLPDVVFLDIEMPYGTGFDLLKRFDAISFEVIFTTAFDKYALKAIKCCALDYLLKPISIEELLAAIRKLKSRKEIGDRDERFLHFLKNMENQYQKSNKIALPMKDAVEFVPISSIIYCKAEGNYTLIIFKDRPQSLITRKIKHFEDLLTAYEFLRVHNSYIVNTQYIWKYVKTEGGTLLLDNKAEIPVSRRKKEALLKTLGLV